MLGGAKDWTVHISCSHLYYSGIKQPEVVLAGSIAPDAVLLFLQLEEYSPVAVKELPSALLVIIVVPEDDLSGEEGLEQEGREVHLDVVRRDENVDFPGWDSLEGQAHAHRRFSLWGNNSRSVEQD